MLPDLLAPLLDPLGLSFIQRALLSTLVMSLVAGVLSCWLILIGWSLMGDAVSHAVLPGIVIATVLGLPMSLGALIAAVIAVWAVGAVRSGSSLREDTSIGIVFSTLFALGVVLLSVLPVGSHAMDILFGNLFGISDAALAQVLIFGGIAAAVMLLAARPLTLWAFDPVHTRSLGFSTGVVRWLLMVSLACVVVASVQAVGVILVVAMLITPGATAYLWTRRFRTMLWLSPAVAAASSVVGIALSYHLDVAGGGMIIVVQSTLFAVAYLFAPREGVLTTRWRRRAAAAPPI